MNRDGAEVEARGGPLLQELGDCRDAALVGGKAVNLGSLIRAGFPVPGGFVVTTRAYRLAHAGRRALVEAPAADGNGGGNGGGHAEASPRASLPPAVAEAVVRAYRALGSPPVAVRSSATAEDLHEASMAGQYETFLDVRGEEQLLECLRHCWASLDTPRTRTYLARHEVDPAHVAMAVVVQKLVAADVSGVLFTANPQNGSRREMLLEASWGLGEAIVSGRVQPDVLRIERSTGQVLSSVVADKRVCIEVGAGAREVDEARRQVACLRSPDVERLWRLGLRAEDSFGAPQDLEWAIEGGELFLLQSRPITTLAHAEAYEGLLQETRQRLRGLLAEGRGPWVRHNISETLKHPTTLTWSVVRRFMSGAGGYGNLYRMAGFEPSPRACAGGFLERIGGLAYMDLALAGEMFFADYPFRYDLAQVRADPDAAQGPPTVPAGTLAQRWRALGKVRGTERRLRELARDFDARFERDVAPAFAEWVAAQKRVDLSSLSADGLIEAFREREAKVLDQVAPQTLLPSLVAAMALADLRSFLDEQFRDEDPDALASLLSSAHAPDRTLLANAELFEVAEGRRTVEAWLAGHGHRAPDEFDLATPRWREQPEALVAMAARLRGGTDPARLHAEHVERVRRRAEELRAGLSIADCRRLDGLADVARRYVRFREDGKDVLMLGYDLLRDVALEAGRRLDVGDDVFHLSREELFDALRVGFAPTHVIARRRAEYAAEARLVMPMVIDAEALEDLGTAPAAATSSTVDNKALTGFAVSAGVATGPARVVRSPQQAVDLGQGYVLVCPSTDPNWTPLFVNAAALVLECGGTLSHGAVVAREMSIPAVVLPGATALLGEGEMVTVDGRAGSVQRSTLDVGRSTFGPDGERPTSNVEPRTSNDGAVAAAAAAADTRIPRPMVPPVPGQRERRNRRIRNLALGFWGLYLLAAFVLPESWLYGPSMAVLDRVLWPLVRDFGKPRAVATIAAAMAALTMVLQKLTTDNARLKEARRRAERLRDEAAALPEGSPRRLAMERLAAPVQLRVVAAALFPIALLLGPMVMVFLWLPARVDPASWAADPGTPVTIVATVDSGLRKPVRLAAPESLALYPTTPQVQTLPPVRETLVRVAEAYQRPTDLSGLPWNAQEAARAAGERKLAELRAFLAAGVPPRPVQWRLDDTHPKSSLVTAEVRVEGEPPVRVDLVHGTHHPPAPTLLPGNGRSIREVTVAYDAPKSRRVFWTTWQVGDWTYEPGWLLVYLLAYIPMMFFFKWLLGVV